jgi:hypothetical protein
MPAGLSRFRLLIEWNLEITSRCSEVFALVGDLTPEALVIPQFQLDTLDHAPPPNEFTATTAQPNQKSRRPTPQLQYLILSDATALPRCLSLL